MVTEVVIVWIRLVQGSEKVEDQDVDVLKQQLPLLLLLLRLLVHDISVTVDTKDMERILVSQDSV